MRTLWKFYLRDLKVSAIVARQMRVMLRVQHEYFWTISTIKTFRFPLLVIRMRSTKESFSFYTQKLQWLHGHKRNEKENLCWDFNEIVHGWIFLSVRSIRAKLHGAYR